MTVKFAKLTQDESILVGDIARRAKAIHAKYGNIRTLRDIEMDLQATHFTCPLDFQKLADADDVNLIHDVGGIANNLNRQTGELEHHFLPRCALPEATAA